MRAISTNHQKYNTNNFLKNLCLNNFLFKISSIIKSYSEGAILDVGCGEGYLEKYYLEKYFTASITGIDISAEAISMAKDKVNDVKFLKANIYNMPFSENSFQLVVCLEVLEHLKNFILALEQLKKVSSKYILISIPHEPYFSLGNFLSLKNWSRLGSPVDHLNLWHKQEFLNILEKNFKVKKIYHSFPWLIFLLEK